MREIGLRWWVWNSGCKDTGPAVAHAPPNPHGTTVSLAACLREFLSKPSTRRQEGTHRQWPQGHASVLGAATRTTLMTLADFATGGILLVILTGVIALPYLVHFDDQKMERPVVVFRCVLWKTAALTLYTLILNGLLVFFCYSIVAITRQHQEQGMLFYVFVLFAGGLLLRMTIIQTWLHLTYWYHDWRTVLIIDRPAHMVTYTRAGRTVKFALNDFVRFIRYESHGR